MAKSGKGGVWVFIWIVIIAALTAQYFAKQRVAPVRNKMRTVVAVPSAGNGRTDRTDKTALQPLAVKGNHPGNQSTDFLNPIHGTIRAGRINIPTVIVYLILWLWISAGIAGAARRRNIHHLKKGTYYGWWAGLFGAGLAPGVLILKLLPDFIWRFCLLSAVMTGIALFVSLRSLVEKRYRSAILDYLAWASAVFYTLTAGYVLLKVSGQTETGQRLTDLAVVLPLAIGEALGTAGVCALMKYMAGAEKRRVYKLIEALKSGDLPLIQKILRKKVLVDLYYPGTNVPVLHEAIRKNQTAIVEALLNRGARPDITDFDGNSALMVAVEAGSPELVGLLIRRRAKVNHCNRKNRTALNVAATDGNTAVAGILLAAGADPNLGGQELPPLISAAYYGHVEMVRLLLEKGADVNAQNDRGVTALIWAAEKGLSDIAALLLENKADVQLKSDTGSTALMQAAGFGHERLVSFLLDYGAQLNDQDQNGETPLMRAAHYGHEMIVELLIHRGADKWLETDNRWTALMFALKAGYLGVIHLLLDGEPEDRLESVDFNLFGNQSEGRTAVMTLAEINHPAGTRVLCRLLENALLAEAAAMALDKIGVPEEPAVQVWYWTVRHQWSKVVAFGTLAVKPLIAMLNDINFSLRMSATEALGKIGAVEAVEPLINLLVDTNATAAKGDAFGRLEKTVITALGALKDPRAVEPLLAKIKDSSPGVRQAAAEALGRIGDTQAVEPLLAMLNCEWSFDSRKAVVVALGEIDSPVAIEPLVRLLGSDEQRNVALGDVIIAVLEKIGLPDDPELQVWYWITKQDWEKAAALGGVGIEALTASLKDVDGKRRQGAAETLRKLGNRPAMVEPLIADLNNPNLRKYACEALGILGDTAAVIPLIQLLGKENVPTSDQQTAARALVRLYQNGDLDEQSKQQILSSRGMIINPHVDNWHETNNSSDCTSWHEDYGIGVEFPI